MVMSYLVLSFLSCLPFAYRLVLPFVLPFFCLAFCIAFSSLALSWLVFSCLVLSLLVLSQCRRFEVFNEESLETCHTYLDNKTHYFLVSILDVTF